MSSIISKIVSNTILINFMFTAYHGIRILDGNNITGTIPQEFGNLTSLTTLNLQKNHLNGSIPDTLGHLSKLEIL